MSLDVIVGKPVPPPENAAFVPQTQRWPDADEVEDTSMSEQELFRRLLRLQRRAGGMHIAGGTPGPGRVITQHNLME